MVVGKGDDLTNSMTRDVDLTGATTAALDLQARFEIEADYDYLYVQASTDGGTTWTSLDGTVGGEPSSATAATSPPSPARPAASGCPSHVPLDAYAGRRRVRFLYRTDGGVAPDGFFADEIVVTADGAPVVTSGAEDRRRGLDARRLHGDDRHRDRRRSTTTTSPRTARTCRSTST